MKLIVFGSKGQLGREFCDKFDALGYNYQAFDIDSLDITDPKQAELAINLFRPHFIINCAAYNQVDKAETDYESAYKSNALGIKYIAQSAEKTGAFIVHFGTDYVFDGLKNEPYIESDETNPLNKYGLTKLEGEKLLKENTDNYLIFRLSWVYGRGTQNFIKKLIDWSKHQDVLKIAEDEISVPTSTRTVVEITLSAIDNGLSGLYHLTNSGFASRYEWATEILKMSGINKTIFPASKNDFKLAALRPRFSAMDNTKVSQELNTAIPHWKDALKDFLSGK